MILAPGHAPLFAYICRLVGSGPEAEDLYQEIHVRYLRFKPAEDLEKARPWLFRVARNLAYDWSRRRRRRPSVPLEAEREEGSGTLLEILPSEERSPEALLEGEDLQDRVKALLTQMPRGQYEVAVRRLFHGMSFKEISDDLGIPLGTALGRFHAAAKLLRKELGDDYG